MNKLTAGEKMNEYILATRGYVFIRLQDLDRYKQILRYRAIDKEEIECNGKTLLAYKFIM